jgi:hypothetical protein
MNSGQSAEISPYDIKSLDFLFFSYRQQIVDVVERSAYPAPGVGNRRSFDFSWNR